MLMIITISVPIRKNSDTALAEVKNLGSQTQDVFKFVKNVGNTTA